MNDHREAEQVRRMAIVVEIDKAELMIVRYREGLDFFRNRMNKHYKRLGHIAERLGEPDEEDAP